MPSSLEFFDVSRVAISSSDISMDMVSTCIPFLTIILLSMSACRGSAWVADAGMDGVEVAVADLAGEAVLGDFDQWEVVVGVLGAEARLDTCFLFW